MVFLYAWCCMLSTTSGLKGLFILLHICLNLKAPAADKDMSAAR